MTIAIEEWPDEFRHAAAVSRSPAFYSWETLQVRPPGRKRHRAADLTKATVAAYLGFPSHHTRVDLA
ncbi:hypothetical protein BH11GEM1_BH11GEM1_19320 [soil metagenome]